MPRPKTEKRDQQVYKLAQYGATVTIDYDVKNPPPFFQPGPGIVIVGEHVCQPEQAQAARPTAASTEPPQHPAKLVRNFEVSEDDPEYLAFKASLEARTGPPAPADFSPRVITSEDLLRATPGFEGIDLNAAIANAPDWNGTEG